jgi:hypothetical protein
MCDEGRRVCDIESALASTCELAEPHGRRRRRYYESLHVRESSPESQTIRALRLQSLEPLLPVDVKAVRFAIVA